MKTIDLRDVYEDCLLDETDDLQVDYDELIVHIIPDLLVFYFRLDHNPNTPGDYLDFNVLYNYSDRIGPNLLKQSQAYLRELLEPIIKQSGLERDQYEYVDGIFSVHYDKLYFCDMIAIVDGKEEVVYSHTNDPIIAHHKANNWKELVTSKYFPTKIAGDFIVTYIHGDNHDRIFYPASEIKSFCEYEKLIDLEFIWKKISTPDDIRCSSRISRSYPKEFRNWIESKERILYQGYKQLVDDIVGTLEIVGIEEGIENPFDLTDPKHPKFNKLPMLTRKYFSDPAGVQTLWRLLKPTMNLTWKETIPLEVEGFPTS